MLFKYLRLIVLPLVLGVPEPGTLSLFGLAGVLLLTTRRRAS